MMHAGLLQQQAIRTEHQDIARSSGDSLFSWFTSTACTEFFLFLPSFSSFFLQNSQKKVLFFLNGYSVLN